MHTQLPSSSVVQHGTLRRDTRVAAPPSLKPELVMYTRPASCGFSNFFRVCLQGASTIVEYINIEVKCMFKCASTTRFVNPRAKKRKNENGYTWNTRLWEAGFATCVSFYTAFSDESSQKLPLRTTRLREHRKQYVLHTKRRYTEHSGNGEYLMGACILRVRISKHYHSR